MVLGLGKRFEVPECRWFNSRHLFPGMFTCGYKARRSWDIAGLNSLVVEKRLRGFRSSWVCTNIQIGSVDDDIVAGAVGCGLLAVGSRFGLCMATRGQEAQYVVVAQSGFKGLFGANSEQS